MSSPLRAVLTALLLIGVSASTSSSDVAQRGVHVPTRPDVIQRFFFLSPQAPKAIGDIVAGMARHEYDLELRRYNGRGWRAVFFPSGFEHSLTSHAGAAWARSPWAAVQQAARDALAKLEADEAAPRDWTVDESPR